LDTAVVGDTSSSTDVGVHDNDYVDYCGYDWSYVAGLTLCTNLTDGARFCDKHQVYFDLSDFNNLGLGDRNSITCHEFGHTVGLKHRDVGCMTGTSRLPPDLSDHDRDHIRNNY